MQKIIRTQINRDGSVSIWNSMEANKKGMRYHIITKPTYLPKAKIDELNALRDFNRLPEHIKLELNSPEILNHEPSKQGNCLGI